MNRIPSSQSERSVPPERYEEIREILRQKTPEELDRELPGLIETVGTHSIGSQVTVRFVVGVSFTHQGTAFDYWLDRVIDAGDDRGLVIEEEKQAIDDDHRYVVFCFPPDRQFDAAGLRCALLATVEARIHEAEFAPEEPPSRSLLERFSDAIRAFRRSNG